MQEAPDWSAAAAKARAAVFEAIQQLRDLLQTYDPLEIISRVAVYIITDHPEIAEPDTPEKNEAHLEYLISLAAALPFPENAVFPPPDAIQNAIENLTQIHMTASLHHTLDERNKTGTRTPLEEIAAHFRIDKLHVRGEAYWPHLREMLVALLQPHDTKLRELLGFTSEDFFCLMERTESLVQDRLTEEMQVYVAPFVELMRPWQDAMRTDDQPEEAAERFAAFIRENEAAIAAAKEKFDVFGTPNAFFITAETPAEKAILSSLSCRFGDNKLFHGTKPEHSFWPLNDSLTDQKPILAHNGGHYAFHLPKILRSAHVLIGELLRQTDPNYWEHRFVKSRANYLEKETAAVLRQALPHAEVLTSVSYDLSEQGKAGEADIVVTCDDFLIIAECKSSALPDATRRGGTKSAEATLRRTIVGGLNQAERLVGEMTRCGAVKLRPLNRGPETVLKAADFKWVIRMNVTLEMMSPVATSLWMLAENGMVLNPQRCWSVALNDLRVIVEILGSPALFLHYVIRRLDLHDLKAVRACDELDYLMHYVERGLFFREGNQPEADTHLILSGFTKKLDEYYRRIQGVSNFGKKPRVRVGSRTRRMLELLQKARPRHYLTACIEILEFDIPVREELLGKLSEQLATLRQKSVAYALTITANPQNKDGIILATSRDVEMARELVAGRAIEHCRQDGHHKLLVILLGVPIGSAPIYIIPVSPDSEVSAGTVHLLRQLRFEITDHRTTGEQPPA